MELSDKAEAAGFYRSLTRFARRLRKGGTYMKGNLSRASRLFAVLLAASVTMAMSSACGSNKDPSSSAAPSGPEGSAVSDASYSDGSDVPSDVASQPDGSEVSEGSGGSDTSGGSSKEPQKPDTSSKGGQQGQTSSTTSGGSTLHGRQAGQGHRRQHGRLHLLDHVLLPAAEAGQQLHAV